MRCTTHAVKHRHTRTTFVAGKLRPRREPRPCSHAHHAGPFVRRPDLDRWMEEMYAEVGIPAVRFAHFDCRACGSSVSLCHNPREVA